MSSARAHACCTAVVPPCPAATQALQQVDKFRGEQQEVLSERTATPTSQLKFIVDAWMQVGVWREVGSPGGQLADSRQQAMLLANPSDRCLQPAGDGCRRMLGGGGVSVCGVGAGRCCASAVVMCCAQQALSRRAPPGGPQPPFPHLSPRWCTAAASSNGPTPLPTTPLRRGGMPACPEQAAGRALLKRVCACAELAARRAFQHIAPRC